MLAFLIIINGILIIALVAIFVHFKQTKNKLQNELVHLNDNLNNDFVLKTKELKEEFNNLKHKEEHLQSSLVKIEESDRVKTAFLANMSHELRTPLNAILGITDFLKVLEISKEEKNDYLQIIENNCNKVLVLMDDIIDLSRIESGEMYLQKNNFSLNVLLLELYNHYDNYKVKLWKNHIDLIVRKPTNNPVSTIIADKERLQQILSNLIMNAIKYTHDGYVEYGYNVEEIENNQMLKFYVKDTGIGMSKQLQSIIFDRFRQIDQSFTKEYGGSGLGLTVCKSLVKLMGGEMWVESEINIGSTFYFTIPYIIQNVADLPEAD